MKKVLLFINALSAHLDDGNYDPLSVQRLVAPRLALSLDTVQDLWTEIDMTEVQEMASRSDQDSGCLSVAELLPPLIERVAQMHQCSPTQFHCVVVLPAIGHVAALRQLTMEVSRLTGQRLTAILIIGQNEAGQVHLFHVMPELQLDEAFADALQQTREAGMS